MATAQDSTNPPAPAPVSVLPQYPELIMAAIEALDNKKGACKSKISKQIEASNGTLPAAHKTLLSHHLNKMTASGELVVVNNNYVKPDPNAPPRRGRGRPSKPKEPVPEGAVASSPRSRGRPRKYPGALVPVEVPEGAVASSPRSRGRPRKYPGTLVPVELPEGTAAVAAVAAAPAVVSGRKRGRPPKLDKEMAAGTLSPPSSGGRGRGRPKKVVPAGGATSAPVSKTGGKIGRGRPKKVVPAGGATSAPVSKTGGKIGKGRPKKVRPDGEAALSPVSSGKKGRGRPRKVAKTGGDVLTVAVTVATGEKRGRGRPRKVVVTEAPVETD